MSEKIKRTTETAQGLLEYALMIVLVGLIVVIGVSVFGGKNRDTYAGIITALQGEDFPSEEEVPSIFTETACENEVSALNKWKITTQGKKDWTCDGDSLCVENNTASQNFAYSKCPKTKAVPSDYEVELRNAILTGGDGVNLMFRMKKYTQKPSGYAFTFEPDSNTFVLVKWVNGNQTPIASTPAPGYAQFNTPHTIKVQVQGSFIKAYVDGSLVLTAQDSTYTTGGAGVHVAGDGGAACFDDLTIRIAGE